MGRTVEDNPVTSDVYFEILVSCMLILSKSLYAPQIVWSDRVRDRGVMASEVTVWKAERGRISKSREYT
jgi:hypothetical protein